MSSKPKVLMSGISLDSENAIWYADVPHKHGVRVREGGEVLQTVQADRGCFACMLNDTSEPTLFITANEWNGPSTMRDGAHSGQILTIPAPAPRAGFP